MKTNRPTSRLPAHSPTRLPWCALLLAFVFSIAQTASAATNELTTLLQKGLFEEEANHNLDAAKQAYESVITQFDKDRKLAATAIFRLGEVLRKQGKTNEANAQYERVVREFSDQKQLADLARKLSGVRLERTSTGGKDLIALAKDFQWQTVSLNAEIWQAEYESENLRKQRVIQTDAQKLKNIDQRLEDLGSKKARLEQKFEDQLQAFSKLNGLTPEETQAVKFGYSEKGTAMEEVEAMKLLTATKTVTKPPLEIQATTSEEAEEIRRIQALIKNSPDLINAVNVLLSAGGEHDKGAPLHKAAQEGHLQVVTFLLDNGADMKIKTTKGFSPLFLAAANGHKAVVELLVSRGANVRASLPNDQTPLHFASGKGFRSIVELLLQKGADPNARTQSGSTALHDAAARGQKEIAELLINKGADVNAKEANGETPLFISVRANAPDLAKLLISKGANPNTATTDGNTSLWEAVSRKQDTVAELLLKHGADIKVQRDVNSNAKGYSLLHVAAMNRDPRTVELLLKHGMDVNVKADSYAFTPLHVAVMENSQDVLKTLLAAKADLNAQNSSGNTPLHSSVRDSHLGTSEILIHAGADLNAKNSGQFTPLHFAVLGKQRQTVELLLKEGANPNTINSTGQTPLGAAKTSKPPAPELVELLKKYGANENLERLSRISVARPSNNYEIVVFKKKDFDNRFTLLEAIAEAYYPSEWRRAESANMLSFPDLANLSVRRIENGKETTISVDLEAALENGDCSKDFVLEWGDIIEVPERNHNLAETWLWPSHWRENLRICPQRKIEIEVKGKMTPIVLQSPFYVNVTNTGKPGIKTDVHRPVVSQKWTTLAVADSRLLLSSSDPSRIKVKRLNVKTGKVTEFTVNSATNAPPNDLWLREGDVIEIPERDPSLAPQASSHDSQPAPVRAIQTRTLRVPPVQSAPVTPTPVAP